MTISLRRQKILLERELNRLVDEGFYVKIGGESNIYKIRGETERKEEDAKRVQRVFGKKPFAVFTDDGIDQHYEFGLRSNQRNVFYR